VNQGSLRGAGLLLVPAVIILVAFLLLPMANVVEESFRLFIPGRVGSTADAPFTLHNYAELLNWVYFRYFLETFRISLIASVLALVIAFPIAYMVAWFRIDWVRNLMLGFLVTMMFLSSVVRVYALELTFGPVGLMKPISGLLGLRPNSSVFAELLVIAGLMHYVIPMSALILVGTVQNINPRWAEAAQSLGAPRWKAHLGITVPLSLRGILAAFVICCTLNVSAFVIPMILGKGRVTFVSNLIYNRFSEIANYPSGSAISLVMLLLLLLLVYVISRLLSRHWG
jgi:ABC-type spermidine/putrescine transport system permease subunit I